MVRLGWAVMTLMAVACLDTTLPARQAGRVTGQAVLSLPQGGSTPAPGVVVRLPGTSFEAVTNEVGFFEVQPLPEGVDALWLSLDGDHDGVAELQRTVSLKAFGAGPNRETALGAVVMRESATISGRVTLQGRGATGHLGIDVFAPGLPWAATTSDDGAFVLAGLPAGQVDLVLSRAGYLTKRLEGLELSGGQTLTLRPLELEVSMTASPGRVEGVVAFVPQAERAGARVTVVTSSGVVSGLTDERGAFQLEVAAGRAVIVVSRDGFSDARLENVAVLAGATTSVGVVTLYAGSTRVDAGLPQALDAGAGSVGCGDGVVGTAEACDDGNLAPDDGCSPTCALEPQLAGNDCAGAVGLRLVKAGAGVFRALGRVTPAHPVAGMFLCDSTVQASSGVLRLELSQTSRVELSAATGFIVADRCVSSPALACGRALDLGWVPPGVYIVALQAAGDVLVSVTPRTSTGGFCGDGVLGQGERCDDGNAGQYDGCALCAVVSQAPGTACSNAPTYTLSRTAPGVLEAVSTGSSARGDPTLVPRCATTPSTLTRTGWLDLDRPSAVSLRLFSSGATGLVSLALHAANGHSCGPMTELGCAEGPSSSAAALSFASLDAGTYFVVGSISGGAVTELDVTVRQ